MVTMLEIDEVVLKACNEYMKSICGNVLEKRRDTNYEVFNLFIQYKYLYRTCHKKEKNKMKGRGNRMLSIISSEVFLNKFYRFRLLLVIV